MGALIASATVWLVEEVFKGMLVDKATKIIKNIYKKVKG